MGRSKSAAWSRLTGTSAALTRLRSPASVRTLDADAIAWSAPDNAAAILRNVPGIAVQSSGRDGNANLGLTGLPNAAEAGVTASGAHLARSVNGRTLSALLVRSF